MPLLLCQRQPYLQESESKVLSCQPTPTPVSDSTSKKKKKKKKKKTENTVATFDVKLSDSVCFATGGGQPNDVGFIGDAEVVNVFRDAEGEVVHQTLSPVDVGAELKVKIDWQRRYDHMQQHTGQHVISAVFRKYGHETLSWCLTKAPLACFIMLSDAKNLSTELLATVEEEVNNLIRLGTPHNLHIIESMEEAKQHPYFDSHPNKLAQVEGGAVRMMEIQGMEYNMCCGTHLRSLAELQMVHLTGPGNDGKVEFLAGSRANDALDRALKMDVEMKKLLFVGPTDFVSTMARKLGESKAAHKAVQALEKELSVMLAKQAFADAQKDETKLLTIHRPAATLNFLKSIAQDYKQQWDGADLTCSLLLTASNSVEREVESKDGVFVITGPAVVHGRAFAAAVQGNGGGRGMFQGKARSLSKASRAEGIEALTKIL